MLNVYFQAPDLAEQGFPAARQGGRGKRYDLGSERSGEHFRYITQPWFQDDLEFVSPEFQASRVDEKDLQSPTRLTYASASSREFFNKSDLRLEDYNGSNGGPFRALSTVGKSQGGTRKN